MQNDTTANYRHTGSLYYYYFARQGLTLTLAQIKTQVKKKQKKKNFPGCAGSLASLVSRRHVLSLARVLRAFLHTTTNTHRLRPLHRPSIDPEHTTLLTACLKTPLSDAKAPSFRLGLLEPLRL